MIAKPHHRWTAHYAKAMSATRPGAADLPTYMHQVSYRAHSMPAL